MIEVFQEKIVNLEREFHALVDLPSKLNTFLTEIVLGNDEIYKKSIEILQNQSINEFSQSLLVPKVRLENMYHRIREGIPDTLDHRCIQIFSNIDQLINSIWSNQEIYLHDLLIVEPDLRFALSKIKQYLLKIEIDLSLDSSKISNLEIQSKLKFGKMIRRAIERCLDEIEKVRNCRKIDEHYLSLIEKQILEILSYFEQNSPEQCYIIFGQLYETLSKSIKELYSTDDIRCICDDILEKTGWKYLELGKTRESVVVKRNLNFSIKFIDDLVEKLSGTIYEGELFTKLSEFFASGQDSEPDEIMAEIMLNYLENLKSTKILNDPSEGKLVFLLGGY